MSRMLSLSLRAHQLLTQTMAFTHLLSDLGPRTFGPAVELESPSPSIDTDWCLRNGVARCWDSSSNSMIHAIVICKGSNIRPPTTRSTWQKYQIIVTQNIQQKFLHIGKWSHTPSLKRANWAINMPSQALWSQWICHQKVLMNCCQNIDPPYRKCPVTPMFYATVPKNLHSKYGLNTTEDKWVTK